MVRTKGSEVLSDNFYWKGKENGNYQSLLQVPHTQLEKQIKATIDEDVWTLSGTLKNNSSVPALMVRLKVVGNQSSNRILPVDYNDNYFFLMPGEEKQVCITLSARDAGGETPELQIEGFNL